MRYVLTSLMCKHAPVELQSLPRGDMHKCRTCKEEARQARQKYIEENGAPGMTDRFNDDYDDPWDLSDED